MECNLKNNLGDEVHVKHKSHMACLSSSMSLTFIMALHSSLEKQWVSPFFSINFLFLKKVLSFENFGDFVNTFSLFI